jgi:hypothetical protein
MPCIFCSVDLWPANIFFISIDVYVYSVRSGTRTHVHAFTNICLVSTETRVMNFSGTNYGHAPAKSFHTAGKLLLSGLGFAWRNASEMRSASQLLYSNRCVCVRACVRARAVCWIMVAGNVVVCPVYVQVFERVYPQNQCKTIVKQGVLLPRGTKHRNVASQVLSAFQSGTHEMLCACTSFCALV